MMNDRNKTDKELSDFMLRVKCTREYAETIPLKTLLSVIAIIPEKPIPLTQTEMEVGLRLAKEIADGYRKPIKIIKRVQSSKPKHSN